MTIKTGAASTKTTETLGFYDPVSAIPVENYFQDDGSPPLVQADIISRQAQHQESNLLKQEEQQEEQEDFAPLVNSSSPDDATIIVQAEEISLVQQLTLDERSEYFKLSSIHHETITIPPSISMKRMESIKASSNKKIVNDDDDDDVLAVLKRKWFHPATDYRKLCKFGVFFLTPILVWDYASIYIFHDWDLFRFAAIFNIIALLATYVALCQCINATYITFDKTQVSVKHWPLVPIQNIFRALLLYAKPKNQRLALTRNFDKVSWNQIKSVCCFRRAITTYRQDLIDNKTRHHFEVHILLEQDDPQRQEQQEHQWFVFISHLATPEEALFIEQEMESFLSMKREA